MKNSFPSEETGLVDSAKHLILKNEQCSRQGETEAASLRLAFRASAIAARSLKLPIRSAFV